MTERRTSRILVVGADANTLKDIGCSFPLPGLSAIVGVSGSGKSSLLGDTLAAELARRDALFHGRALRDGAAGPVRAFIGPAPPSLHVTQRPFRASARTTVATAAGLLAGLRRLFLPDGAPRTDAGEKVAAPSPDLYAQWLHRHYRGTAIVWAIPHRWTGGDGTRAVGKLLAHGIATAILRSETDRPEVHVTGRPVELAGWKPLRPGVRFALDAEIGRVNVSPQTSPDALTALLAEAWEIAGPDVIVELPDDREDLTAGPLGTQIDGRRDWVHPALRQRFRAPDAHLLSFNVPEHPDSGACPRCLGLGRVTDLDEAALVIHPDRSLRDGAISLWASKACKHVNIQHATIEGLSGRHGFRPDIPWNRLSPAAHAMILDGTGDEDIQGIDPATGRKQGAPRRFEGFRKAILQRWAASATGAERLGHLVREGICPECGGSRWSPTARALRAAGLGLAEWLDQPMTGLAVLCRQPERATGLSPEGRAALQRLGERADVLCRLGLGHLAGSRGMLAISDGEARRLQIGAVLAVPTDGLALLLDEPARGLHEEDLDPMLTVLRQLAGRHAVLVNEHRGKVMAAADHVVELGPGPGPAGGEVEYEGPPRPFSAPVLGGTARPDLGWLVIEGIDIHTVHDQVLRLPLGTLTAIVGVSGSGKSSAVRGALIPALAALGKVADAGLDPDDRIAGHWSAVRGAERIRRLHVLHQRVPPRNRRSLVATMTGAIDAIAAAYAATTAAGMAGLSAEDFRLNGGQGRCPECKGTGESPLDQSPAPCPACGGRRYGPPALGPMVAGLDIAGTLGLPASSLPILWEARGEPALAGRLGPLCRAMDELGIGHLAFGRRIDTLSGGEVQRLRVALTLAGQDAAEGHLFILDEPAAGLHPTDTERLVGVLRRMADGGRNTVVVIEHNMHLVARADWLVEFGDGAGTAGGRIVAEGSPSKLAGKDTPTGRALLAMGAGAPRSPAAAPAVSPGEAGEVVASAETGWLDRVAAGDLGEDRPVPAAKDDALSRLLDPRRRVWEIADLNLEIGKLLLDIRNDAAGLAERRLLETWAATPDARLVVNPAVTELRIWGPRLPRSLAKAVLGRATRLGLTPLGGVPLLSGLDDAILCAHAGMARAAFPTCNAGNDAERRQQLDHALAIGGGYAELCQADGAVLVALARVPLDLERGVAGPGRPDLPHLSRLRPQGACPACRGAGVVDVADEALLLNDAAATPLDPEPLLHPQAAALLKGIWRTDAKPFFRRLEDEGLADHDPDGRRNRLLFGVWRRPGHGSFLKSPKDDPEEVGSWLRWDGLYRHLWAGLPRGRDGQWRAAVIASRRSIPCPTCGGSGHGILARLLTLGERSLADWTTQGSVAELMAALKALPVKPGRQNETRARIIGCLEPLARLAPERTPGAPVTGDDPACRAVAVQAVRLFTTVEIPA
jgi:excinuclease ABC A subunit